MLFLRRHRRKVFDSQKRGQIIDKCFGKCAYCGSTLTSKDTTIDHIHPLSEGGSNKGHNLLPSCSCCNFFKGTLKIREFRELLFNLNINGAHTNLEKEIYKRFHMDGKIRSIKFYYEKIKESRAGTDDDRWAWKLEKLRKKYNM